MTICLVFLKYVEYANTWEHQVKELEDQVVSSNCYRAKVEAKLKEEMATLRKSYESEVAKIEKALI